MHLYKVPKITRFRHFEVTIQKSQSNRGHVLSIIGNYAVKTAKALCVSNFRVSFSAMSAKCKVSQACALPTETSSVNYHPISKQPSLMTCLTLQISNRTSGAKPETETNPRNY